VALCEHCLLEVPPGTDIRDDDGRLFCCQGCRAVSRFIRGEGLLAFYRRREWKVGEGERPSPGEVGDEEPYRDRIRERGGKPEVELFVEGIRCSACVWLVEQVLRRTPGVTTARVNYVTHQAAIGWDPRQTGLREILARIVAAGYLPRPYSPSAASRARREESRGLLMRLGTAAFLSAQIMTYSLAFPSWLTRPARSSVRPPPA
jgi:Cu2+-exporting ATPase